MKKILFVCCMMLVLSIFTTGCIPESSRSIATTFSEQQAMKAITSTPVPEVTNFLERKTITEWYKTWDKPNIPTFVYLISYGKVLGYYVANGKPASTRSYVVPEYSVEHTGNGPVVLPTQDLDGTYGENNAGIRFFTADGSAVEWAGDGASYLYSNTPINFGYEVPLLQKRKEYAKGV